MYESLGLIGIQLPEKQGELRRFERRRFDLY